MVGNKGYRKASWTSKYYDAKALCERYGYRLATFTTDAEIAVVKDFASQGDDLWVGLSNPTGVK